MLDFLINYWGFILLGIAGVSVAGYCIYTFVKMPSTDQLNKVKEWLLYAVTAAEKEFGSGTGKIKLRYVYDMFIAKFPYLVKVVPFEAFSVLVDEVLETFRELLDKNEKIDNYVKGE